MLSDQEIITQALAGDKSSLRELVIRYEKTIYSFAFKLCRNKERAEHTMQETFLNMIKSLHQFDNNSKFSTWLYTIVLNNCFLLARNEKKQEYSPIENENGIVAEFDAEDVFNAPDKLAENEELKKILDNAIKKLEPEYRVVFVLRDVEELSTEETAKATGLSVPAVKSRLHRARKFLKEEITKALKHDN